ncbi:hypothetical protein FIBSPDRAFT_996642 [Athelia psychrophila]|uniref:Uncharacterized protein n=1 Tax=Athelia psychrophila TaxID=1759441 RepID=A0A165WTH5_9AGAM|nr:hypothetical protein FIBSPDRAFT_996642 [Fibularhizoctonia sp. CBS 109695]
MRHGTEQSALDTKHAKGWLRVYMSIDERRGSAAWQDMPMTMLACDITRGLLEPASTAVARRKQGEIDLAHKLLGAAVMVVRTIITTNAMKGMTLHTEWKGISYTQMTTGRFGTALRSRFPVAIVELVANCKLKISRKQAKKHLQRLDTGRMSDIGKRLAPHSRYDNITSNTAPPRALAIPPISFALGSVGSMKPDPSHPHLLISTLLLPSSLSSAPATMEHRWIPILERDHAHCLPKPTEFGSVPAFHITLQEFFSVSFIAIVSTARIPEPRVRAKPDLSHTDLVLHLFRPPGYKTDEWLVAHGGPSQIRISAADRLCCFTLIRILVPIRSLHSVLLHTPSPNPLDSVGTTTRTLASAPPMHHVMRTLIRRLGGKDNKVQGTIEDALWIARDKPSRSVYYAHYGVVLLSSSRFILRTIM